METVKAFKYDHSMVIFFKESLILEIYTEIHMKWYDIWGFANYYPVGMGEYVRVFDW